MKNVVFQHSDWEQKKVWKKGKYVHRCTVKERIRMSWFVRGVRTVRGQWLFRAEGNGKSFVIEMYGKVVEHRNGRLLSAV